MPIMTAVFFFFFFQMRMPKGPTVPKPFNLSTGSKRKLEDTSSEYVSLAQQVEAFQKRTPSRYHLRSRKSDEGKQTYTCTARKLHRDSLLTLLGKQSICCRPCC